MFFAYLGNIQKPFYLFVMRGSTAKGVTTDNYFFRRTMTKVLLFDSLFKAFLLQCLRVAEEMSFFYQTGRASRIKERKNFSGDVH